MTRKLNVLSYLPNVYIAIGCKHIQEDVPDDSDVDEDGEPLALECARCHRPLTYDSGVSVTALSIVIKDLDSEIGHLIRRQLGIYNPTDSDNIRFDFCYQCYINSLFK